MTSRFSKILLPALGLLFSGRLMLTTAQAGVTNDALADAVTAHVKAETQQAGGTFGVDDPAEEKKLALTLQRVHTTPLKKVAPDTYVACVQFSSTDAHLYDIDIVMKGPNNDHLTFSEASVHKKDGVARYSWYEQGGMWKKQMIGAATGSTETPKDKAQPK